MSSYNKVTLFGNIGRDAELKYLPSGQAVSEFSLATSRTWKDKEGEKQEETAWHNIKLWGKTAESLSQYLLKGTKVLVDGRLEYRKWEKDGIKHERAEVVAEQIVLAGKNSGGQSAPERASPAAAPRRQNRSAAPVLADENVSEEDLIPF